MNGAARLPAPGTWGDAALRRLFSVPTITRDQAVARMERIGACTHLMASLEHLARPGHRARGGLNDWTLSRDGTAVRSRLGRRVLDQIARPRVTSGLHALRVLAAAGLITTRAGRRRRSVAGAALAGTSLLLHPRHHYGTDGSDQVAFLVQTASALARATRDPVLVDRVLWTVALQSTLSYTVSGWAKLAGPSWRQGTALTGVARTMTYGDRRSWSLLRDHPRLARVLGAGVLALECVAPVAHFSDGRLARPYTLATAALHLGIAHTMALGRFVPAFLSMHPAVLYTARRGSSVGGPREGRDDAVPRTAAALSAALVGAALVQRARVRRRVLAGRPASEVLESRSGARVSWRCTGSDRGPVVVCETALLATPEHWAWLERALSADAAVVTYTRPGYGASTAPPGTAVTLGDLEDVLVELLDAVAERLGDRPVVLVGHSLGGVLALRAAARREAQVRAVVLLDSSHPQEIARSPRQAAGAAKLDTSLSLVRRSLDLGCGALLSVPDWVRSLPEDARPAALDHYRDGRMWAAAMREWAATVRDFGADTALPSTSVPVLALSAARTLEQEALQGDLHREMAAAGGPLSRHEVLAGCDHDSILTGEDHAEEVARRLLAFLAEASAARRDDAPAHPSTGAGPQEVTLSSTGRDGGHR